MGLFEQFPYTNFHELNLDWVIQKVQDFDAELQNIDAQITNIVQEYLQNVEMNALYVPATKSIILSFDNK